MRMKQMFAWNWKISWISLAVTIGALVLANVVVATIFSVVEVGEQEGFSVNTASMLILPFIVGIVNFGSALRFGGVNGVSRRSTFGGTMGFMFSFAAASAFGNIFLSLIMKLFGFSGDWDLYNKGIFGVWSQDKALWQCIIAYIVLFIAIGIVLIMLGYFLGGCFYRLGKIGKILLAAGVPVLVFAGLPILFVLLPEGTMQSIIRWWSDMYATLVSSPYMAALVMLPIGIVTAVFGWLLIRRAPVTPVASN